MATLPLTGHVTPGLSVARALVGRGHTVRWYTSGRFREKVEATGATLVPMEAHDWDERQLDQAFPGRAHLRGAARLKFDLKHAFIDAMPAQADEVERALRSFPADVLVGDSTFLGVPLLSERLGLPYATFGVTALAYPSRDIAPFGLGLHPSASVLGRLRNRLLASAVDRFLFRDVMNHLTATRARLGHSALQQANLFELSVGRFLYLQSTVPSFEYPRCDLPPQVHFIGPFLPQAPASFSPPAWWPDLDTTRPVVHVTQGTATTDADHLLVPTLRALANDDVLVVATTGGPPVESVRCDPMPDNARVATFLPYFHLLPKVSVMVTNAGYGGVQAALSHGVPMVVAGDTEEKPEIAARVAWAGVGVNLKTAHPTPGAIRAAVRRVLDSPHYRAHARRLQTEMASYDAPVRAAELLEQLAATRAPVHRITLNERQLS